MRTERELAHVLGHERELELSSHFGSRDELNEERVQILASDSERELAHIFHELLMLCKQLLNLLLQMLVFVCGVVRADPTFS